VEDEDDDGELEKGARDGVEHLGLDAQALRGAEPHGQGDEPTTAVAASGLSMPMPKSYSYQNPGAHGSTSCARRCSTAEISDVTMAAAGVVE
jgi:hypothetical protein